jgi:hypothetical protein
MPDPYAGEEVKIDPTRPFRLREYESAFAGFAYTAINALMMAKHPVLSQIKTVPAAEIHTSRNTTDSDEVIENPPIRMALEFRIDLKDVVAGNFAPVVDAINSSAEQGVRELAPQVTNYMTKVINAFGKGIDLKGAPFDHNAVRLIVEANEIEFDDTGKPDLEPWIFTSHNFTRVTTFAEMFRMFPPQSVAEHRIWDEMIERKRVAFNADKRHRTLS